MTEGRVFDRIYRDYLKKFSAIDFERVRDRLGLNLEERCFIIPFLGTPYRISPEGITDCQGKRPSHDVSTVLFKYLLMRPEEEPSGSGWLTYKDFKDAAPFVEGFSNTVEKAISKNFAGKLSSLKSACEALNGMSVDLGVSYDLSVKFEALPKVPIELLFNDEEEEFPAQCSVLFERRAERYLDMECLAITGMILSRRLTRQEGK